MVITFVKRSATKFATHVTTKSRLKTIRPAFLGLLFVAIAFLFTIHKAKNATVRHPITIAVTKTIFSAIDLLSFSPLFSSLLHPIHITFQ